MQNRRDLHLFKLYCNAKQCKCSQALNVINYLLFCISYESKVAGSAAARVYKNIDDSVSHMHMSSYNMYASGLPVAADQRLPHHNSHQIRSK